MKITDEKTKMSVDMIEENGEVYYVHPLTGQFCSSIDQALAGFSEQTEKENQGWDRISDSIKNDNEKVSEFFDQGCEIYLV